MRAEQRLLNDLAHMFHNKTINIKSANNFNDSYHYFPQASEFIVTHLTQLAMIP
jgi:hypothetical protein